MQKKIMLKNGDILTVENIKALDNGLLHFFNIDTKKHEALHVEDIISIGQTIEKVIKN